MVVDAIKIKYFFFFLQDETYCPNLTVEHVEFDFSEPLKECYLHIYCHILIDIMAV